MCTPASSHHFSRGDGDKLRRCGGKGSRRGEVVGRSPQETPVLGGTRPSRSEEPKTQLSPLILQPARCHMEQHWHSKAYRWKSLTFINIINCTLKLETSYRWTGCAHPPSIRLTQINEKLEVGHWREQHWWSPSHLPPVVSIPPPLTPINARLPLDSLLLCTCESYSRAHPSPTPYEVKHGRSILEKNNYITWSRVFKRRESSRGPQGWWGDWNIYPTRRGWGSWACSAWRREGWEGT